MKISRRLSIIVMLTVVEVSFTVWATVKISDGATFHQLNSLHLKYNAEFSQVVTRLERGDALAPLATLQVLQMIRQQPVACLDKVSALDTKIMQWIGTSRALDLCRKDIEDADQAIAALDAFQSGEISRSVLINEFRRARDEFGANSAAFEGPITDTVWFLFRTLIPMIVLISTFNVLMITYLSRSIRKSIATAIEVLSPHTTPQVVLETDSAVVSEEMRELIDLARERMRALQPPQPDTESLKAIVEQNHDSSQNAVTDQSRQAHA